MTKTYNAILEESTRFIKSCEHKIKARHADLNAALILGDDKEITKAKEELFIAHEIHIEEMIDNFFIKENEDLYSG